MAGPMERLGTQSDRLETQVSSAGNPQGPDDHFFEVLTEIFNDDQFHAVIPWTYDHVTPGARFEITGRRKRMRQTAVALEAEIQEEDAAVARERRDAVSHQSMRRERENRARMLQMDERDDLLGLFPESTSPQGQSGDREGGEEGSQEEDGGEL